MNRNSGYGFSLVELLVSIAIGMTIVLVVGYAYLSSSRLFKLIEVNSRLQESSRLAFEILAYDARMAGAMGCHVTSSTNVLTNASDYDKNIVDMPLNGFEEDADNFPSGLSERLRGDALSIVRVDDVEYMVGSHNPNSAQFDLLNNAEHNIKPGEILFVADCINHYAAVMQMTGPANNNNNAKNIVHNTGSGGLNCTKYLGTPSDLDDCSSGTSYTFPTGSKIMRLSSNSYFIKENKFGEPALFRQRLGQNGSTSSELIEGIEDMQILYGVDTAITADGSVDQYVTADKVESVAPGVNQSEKWKRVLSIRVSLLMVSANNESLATKPQSYVFNGIKYDGLKDENHGPLPGDNKIRKTFTTTIAIRNRL